MTIRPNSANIYGNFTKAAIFSHIFFFCHSFRKSASFEIICRKIDHLATVVIIHPTLYPSIPHPLHRCSFPLAFHSIQLSSFALLFLSIASFFFFNYFFIFCPFCSPSFLCLHFLPCPFLFFYLCSFQRRF